MRFQRERGYLKNRDCQQLENCMVIEQLLATAVSASLLLHFPPPQVLMPRGVQHSSRSTIYTKKSTLQIWTQNFSKQRDKPSISYQNEWGVKIVAGKDGCLHDNDDEMLKSAWIMSMRIQPWRSVTNFRLERELIIGLSTIMPGIIQGRLLAQPFFEGVC